MWGLRFRGRAAGRLLGTLLAAALLAVLLLVPLASRAVAQDDVQRDVVLVPDRGPPDTVVELRASGAATPCEVRFDNDVVVDQAACAPQGQRPAMLRFQVPAAAAGTHVVELSDDLDDVDGGQLRRALFEVTDPLAVSVQPGQVPAGGVVTKTARNLHAPCTVQLDGRLVVEEQTCAPDGGTFETDVAVPEDAVAGTDALVVCSACGQAYEERGSASFVVTAVRPTPSPTPTATPSPTPTATPSPTPTATPTPSPTPTATPTASPTPTGTPTVSPSPSPTPTPSPTSTAEVDPCIEEDGEDCDLVLARAWPFRHADPPAALLYTLLATLAGVAFASRSPLAAAIVRETLSHPLRRVRITVRAGDVEVGRP